MQSDGTCFFFYVNRFGMCDSLAQTLGRPCPVWLVISVACIFFGPICFMVFAFWTVARNVKKGSVTALDLHPLTFSPCARDAVWSYALSEPAQPRSAGVAWRRKHNGCKIKTGGQWWSSHTWFTHITFVRLMVYEDIETIKCVVCIHQQTRVWSGVWFSASSWELKPGDFFQLDVGVHI